MKCTSVIPHVAPPITPEQFKKLLPTICTKETASESTQNNWTKENPLWGHCAVVSVVAQNLFGGELLRASLEGTLFESGGSHYWNRLADKTEEDFTKAQFGDNFPQDLKPIVRDREYVLKTAKNAAQTEKRYKLLAFRLAKTLNNNNPLFDDPIYKACFETALDSECQKMKFGCAITHNSEVIYLGFNATIEPLKSLCEPECIRFKIQSRTEQMLGACGHAEEKAISEVSKNRKDISLSDCDLYIAGLYPNGLPWIKQKPEHTCLRCAVPMYNANLRTIYVPVIDKWIGITPTEALETARAYATGEEKV